MSLLSVPKREFYQTSPHFPEELGLQTVCWKLGPISCPKVLHVHANLKNRSNSGRLRETWVRKRVKLSEERGENWMRKRVNSEWETGSLNFHSFSHSIYTVFIFLTQCSSFSSLNFHPFPHSIFTLFLTQLLAFSSFNCYWWIQSNIFSLFSFGFLFSKEKESGL